jgi:addiction module RelE/StbE family toxin
VKLRWLRTASASLRLHISFIASENPRAAAAVRHRIRAAVRRLTEFSESGRTGQVAGTRELVVPGLPYVVVYRVGGDYLEILRVFHTSTSWMNEKNMQ